MQHSFEAVVFDLDGVITKTAEVHSKAWKSMFDDFLRSYSEENSIEFKEFTSRDYLEFVDGKPRYEGVQSFLASRSVTLPFGDPSDKADATTVCGLGNRKNEVFREILENDGVEVYESTLELIKELKAAGIRVGVASSSKNCQFVLQSRDLEDLFEVRIDGAVSAERGIKGKPAPDIFLTACADMGVDYERTVVVEDAVSGVAAGQRGRFGLVLGLAREDNHEELASNGADIVVSDISETSVEAIEEWFKTGKDKDSWNLTYKSYEPEKELTREALLTVGNGFFGTRGALEETSDNGKNYPGTYVAGLFNRLDSQVADRTITNEDFVNCPNWLPVRVTVSNQLIDPNSDGLSKINRTLNLRTGTLEKMQSFICTDGTTVDVQSDRFVSMADKHIATLRYEVTVSKDSTLKLETALDGSVTNNGVARYRELESQHLCKHQSAFDEGILSLSAATTQSEIIIAEAAKHDVTIDGKAQAVEWDYTFANNCATLTTNVEVKAGQTITLMKTIALHTSRESSNPQSDALSSIKSAPAYDEIRQRHEKSWKEIWSDIDVKIDGDRLAEKILRLHAYHMLVTASKNSLGLDAAVPARGLHGEAYRGHIFWDEVFILPWYNLHSPEVSKESILYRYERQEAAKAYAKEHGYKGTMFPWQSGSDGSEETQVVHLNPLSGKWGPDYSSFQRHVSLSVAFNVWQYCHMAKDNEFWHNEGAELYLNVCHFWSSKAEYSEESKRFHIKNVMGPNEYHEHAKNCEGGGLIDNGYTNILTSWILDKGVTLYNELSDKQKEDLESKTGIDAKEVARWSEVSTKLNLVIEDEVIAHFDGFFELEKLDFAAYEAKYGNIYRMDRLLKKEGKSPDDYQVCKQADTLMAFFLLGTNGVKETLTRLGYQDRFTDELLRKNYNFYLPVTTHGSTLSRIAHADLAQIMGDPNLSFDLYTDALFSDFKDVQGGTTGEGIHCGVMAASIYVALARFAGFDFGDELLSVEPRLPEFWKGVSGKFTFRKQTIQYSVTKDQVELKFVHGEGEKVLISVKGETIELKKAESAKISLDQAKSLSASAA